MMAVVMVEVRVEGWAGVMVGEMVVERVEG